MSDADLSDTTAAPRQAQYTEKQIEEVIYIPYSGEPVDPGYPARRPLPSGLTSEGRLVWEPPVTIDYDDLMGENYAKLRKAIMDFTGGDRAKTTEFLDWDMEDALCFKYHEWAARMIQDLYNRGDEEATDFFFNLLQELRYDAMVDEAEGYERIGAIIMGEGSDEDPYVVECHNPHAPLWEGDPHIIKKSEEYYEAQKTRIARLHAEREAAHKEEAAKREKGVIRRKRIAQRIRAPRRKLRRHANSRPLANRPLPRTLIPWENARVHSQPEREQNEWPNSIATSPMTIHFRPLVVFNIIIALNNWKMHNPSIERSPDDDVG